MIICYRRIIVPSTGGELLYVDVGIDFLSLMSCCTGTTSYVQYMTGNDLHVMEIMLCFVADFGRTICRELDISRQRYRYLGSNVKALEKSTRAFHVWYRTGEYLTSARRYGSW